MAVSSTQLLQTLDGLTHDISVGRWLIAFSGGIDSTVLLHALATSATEFDVEAIHVNHGLHPDSDQWAAHCGRIAAELGVRFESVQVEVVDSQKKGLEAAAREARYAALQRKIERHDCLLSAHHAGDQAETLLLNLMRGSGVDGLAGIGARQPLGDGLLLRPLLDVSMDSICAYADEHKLGWLEDPSNADTRFDRNFVRRQIVPALEARWPAAVRRIRRSADLLGEARLLLAELANVDLQTVGTADRLNIAELQSLSVPRQRNLLRHAVRTCGLPLPPATQLQRIIDELVPARADAQPLVRWAGVEVRRFRNEIFILSGLTTPLAADNLRLTIDGPPADLGSGLGTIRLVRTNGTGISDRLAKSGLDVRRRSGGEDIRVPHRQSPRKLKEMFQENAVLPWMRSRVPLLYVREQLVAVADLWIDQACQDNPGYVIQWDDRPTLN